MCFKTLTKSNSKQSSTLERAEGPAFAHSPGAPVFGDSKLPVGVNDASLSACLLENDCQLGSAPAPPPPSQDERVSLMDELIAAKNTVLSNNSSHRRCA